ncbi:MAG: hypothetical protein M2R46_02685 [Verrucomicrobia subdivision 3 bacterium]|nr:hypothetical protein [Limisphaerales bacterium]
MKATIILLAFLVPYIGTAIGQSRVATSTPRFYQHWMETPQAIKDEVLRSDPNAERDYQEALTKYQFYKGIFPREFRNFILKKARLIALRRQSQGLELDIEQILYFAELDAIADFELHGNGYLREDGGYKDVRDWLRETRDYRLQKSLELRVSSFDRVSRDFGPGVPGTLQLAWDAKAIVDRQAREGAFDPDDFEAKRKAERIAYRKVKWDFLIKEALGLDHADPVEHLLSQPPGTNPADIYFQRKNQRISGKTEADEVLGDIIRIIDPFLVTENTN